MATNTLNSIRTGTGLVGSNQPSLNTATQSAAFNSSLQSAGNAADKKMAFAPVIAIGGLSAAQIIAAIGLSAAVGFTAFYINTTDSDRAIINKSFSSIVKNSNPLELGKKIGNAIQAWTATRQKNQPLQINDGNEPLKAKTQPQTSSTASTGAPMPPDDEKQKKKREREARITQLNARQAEIRARSSELSEILKNAPTSRISPKWYRARGLKESPRVEQKKLDTEFNKNSREISDLQKEAGLERSAEEHAANSTPEKIKEHNEAVRAEHLKKQELADKMDGMWKEYFKLKAEQPQIHESMGRHEKGSQQYKELNQKFKANGTRMRELTTEAFRIKDNEYRPLQWEYNRYR